MVKIPVSFENLDFERLDLHRHYVVVDCDFTVYLILNPVGEKPLSGTDIAVINIGSWQLDSWKFLVKDNFPNEAGFSAVLAWDKTLVQDTEQGRKRPRITESDVDIASSVSSLKGQPVNITGFSLDDGKSLKVSTLENEFCNVKAFPVPLKKDNLFYTAKLFGSLKVGDVFNPDIFPSVDVVSDVYTIYAPVLSISGLISNNVKSSHSFFHGRYHHVNYNPGSDQTSYFSGCASKYCVNVTVDNNMIIIALSIVADYYASNSSSSYTSGGSNIVLSGSSVYYEY